MSPFLFGGVATRELTHARNPPPARYCANILALGKRRVARPLVSRRLEEGRIRHAAASGAEVEGSVVLKRAPAWPRECAGGRLGFTDGVCEETARRIMSSSAKYLECLHIARFCRRANNSRAEFPHGKDSAAPLS